MGSFSFRIPNSALRILPEEPVKVLQLFPDPEEPLTVSLIGQLQFQLFLPQALDLLQPFLGSRDGEFFLVEEFLHLQDQFQVPFPVQPLLGVGPRRVDDLEFGLPVAKHLGLDPGDLADLSNLIVKLFRNGKIGFLLHGIPSPLGRRRFTVPFRRDWGEKAERARRSGPFSGPDWV